MTLHELVSQALTWESVLPLIVMALMAYPLYRSGLWLANKLFPDTGGE